MKRDCRDYYVINIAKPYNKGKPDMSGTVFYNHYCRIEKPCDDFRDDVAFAKFIKELTTAFSAIGKFNIHITRFASYEEDIPTETILEMVS